MTLRFVLLCILDALEFQCTRKWSEIEWFAVRSINLIKFTLLICILKKFFKFSLSCYPFPRKLNWAFSLSAYYEPLTDCSIYWIWYRKRSKLNEMAISIKTWFIKEFFLKIRTDFQYTKLEICLETLGTIQSVLGNILKSIEFSDNIQGLFAHTKMDRKTLFYRGKKSVEFFFFIFNANRNKSIQCCCLLNYWWEKTK